MNVAIILAAGKGVRMKSDLPKVFHKLKGKPMLSYVLNAAKGAGLDKTYVVVGHKSHMIKDFFKDGDIVFVEQEEQLGTGHAVQQVEPYLKGQNFTVVVLSGDMPLISSGTIRKLIEGHKSEGASATVLVAKMDDPHGYGRVLRDGDGKVERIVEEKDANESEKKVPEVNTGIYCFESKLLFDALRKVNDDNAQREFYLTDTISILKNSGAKVFSVAASDQKEAIGVNSKEQLEALEQVL